MNYLLDSGLCSETERRYLEALRKLHSSTAGEGLGIATSDGPFGPLTIIGGRMYMQDGRMVQTMDSRYPTSTNGGTIAAAIRQAIGDGASLEDVDAADPFYIEADTPAIRACIDTYNEVTGKDEKPFTMGGGTYARHFPYAVSFGPESHDLVLWPGEPRSGAALLRRPHARRQRVRPGGRAAPVGQDLYPGPAAPGGDRLLKI